MKEKTINIFILIAYFIVAIVILSSIGIWLPIIIDDYTIGKISPEVNKGLAGNILTYALGLFLVAVIDRIIFLLFRASKYSNNVLEFFFIIFACIGTGYIVFLSLKSLKNQVFDDAICYAKYVAFFAWLVWFYVKLQGSKTNNFSAIGGVI